MAIFDVLKPKENHFICDLFKEGQELVGKDLNTLLSSSIIVSPPTVDYQAVDFFQNNFKDSFLEIHSKWSGEIEAQSTTLIKCSDAKIMAGLLMMEEAKDIKASKNEPVTEDDLEVFQEISNQINGSLDNGFRKLLKFDFHLYLEKVENLGNLEADSHFKEKYMDEGYVFARSKIQIADFGESYFLQIFPLSLAKDIISFQFGEIQDEIESENKIVLLVDEDHVTRKLLKSLIKDQAFNILESEDGMDALGILRKQHIDLVIMEAQMPKLNGIQTTQRIKSNPNSRNVPVMLYTEKPTKELVVEAVKNGAEDFLVKPFDDKDFITKRIQKKLEEHQLPS